MMLPSLLYAGLWAAIGSAAAQSSGGLPPPPRAAFEIGDSVVHLELVVNRLPSGRVVAVTLRDGHYFVDARHLHALGVRTGGVAEATPVAVDTLADVAVDYDTARLRLLIDVPPAWLPQQRVGRHGTGSRHPAHSSTGALLNYDVYATSPEHGPSSTSVWSELRVFGNFGFLSSTGAWRDGARGEGLGDGYVRYDTRWQRSDEERMLTWEAGDLVTRGLAWSSAVRMGGVQVSRDFSIRPDVITYPLPQFAGEAAVPTAVDLFINGNRADSARVNPGPFALTNVPYINGAGHAVIVVSDALGRQVPTSIPFYVSSDLLRPGLSDFSFGLGALRRDYGIRDFSYGRAAAQGSYRYGVNDLLTVEAHAEAGRSFALAGLGSVFRLGYAGVFNGAYSRSRHEGSDGYQASFGYQYSTRRFNVSMQHTRRDRGFTDLGVYDTPMTTLGRRTSTSASGSLSLGAYGSLGAGYFDVEGFDETRTRLFNLSWSASPWRNANLYLSGNRELGGDDWSVVVQLVVSLDRERGRIGSSVERGHDRGDTQRLYYSRSIPSQGGFGWNLGYSRIEHGDDYRQVDLAWRNDHVQLRGGVYGSGDYTRWADASGSLVLMGGSAFASNRISDAFVVVDANGHAGVPVRYENQKVGVTNRDGRLLVPWASSYYGGKYEIDPMQLPAHVETPVVEQRVAVRRGGGYLLRFPINRVVAASITLHDTDGRPLPVASVVTTAEGRHAYVGWDGLVYLDGLQARNVLSVRRPDGSECSAGFELDVEREQIAQVGPLVCR